MKKYLVIGNPIDHSLSPELHNYWIKNKNIDAIYEKKKINSEDLEKLIKFIDRILFPKMKFTSFMIFKSFMLTGSIFFCNESTYAGYSSYW